MLQSRHRFVTVRDDPGAMALAEPLWLSRGAWQAILDEAIAPQRSTPDVARLAAAWQQTTTQAERVGVFLDAPLAATLARLLDERPELLDG